MRRRSHQTARAPGKLLEQTYGHHHPDHLKNAARAIGYRTPSREPLVVSLVSNIEDIQDLNDSGEKIGGPGRT
jgi:hypothetical protein